MGIENKVVFMQAIIYFISFFFSFLLFVPMAVNVNEFGGNCLLYSTGEWGNFSTTETILSHVEWGPDGACGLNVFMGVIVMLSSMFYVVWSTMHLVRSSDSSWLEAFVTTVFCLITCLLLFASSLTISVGFNKWCNLLLSSPDIQTCQLGDNFKLTEYKDIHTQNFYTEITLAQFAGWSLWLCWLVLTILAFSKVYKYHNQERFQVSVNRERQRLLQRVGHSAPVAI